MEDPKKIITMCKNRDEFVTDSDGFVYWWPWESRSGHLSAEQLRIIATELDNQNATLAKKLDSYFKGFGAD